MLPPNIPFAQNAGESLVQSIEWQSPPPGWLLVLFILPAIFLFVGAIYSREGERVSTGGRIVMAGLRAAVLLLLVGILADPFAVDTAYREVESHVLVLYDDSQSMRDIRDSYETADSLRLAHALGILEEELPDDLEDESVQRRFLFEISRTRPDFDLDRSLTEAGFQNRISIVNHLLGEDDPTARLTSRSGSIWWRSTSG